MKKLLWATGIVTLSLMGFAGSTMAEGVKEGDWTMTMVTRMSGMDEESAQAMAEMENMAPEEKAMMQQMMGGLGISMGAGAEGITTTVTQCVSNDNPVPDMATEEDCTSTHSMEGSTVHFEVTCPDSQSTGEVTYAEDSMQGTITSQQTENGQVTDVTIEISGEYVGPCSE